MKVPLAQAQDTASTFFPVPDVLWPNIAFWTRIFTALDSSSGVLQDTDDLSIIYQIFKPLPTQRGQHRSLIQRRRRHYQHILSNLARDRGRPRSQEEKRVLALFPKGSTPAVFRTAADNIRFQRGLRDRFVRGLERSGAYMPEIRRIFAAADLPAALTLLPHIESSFDNRAYSKAGAAGIWQFIRATGRRFLTINASVDERYDVYRASRAAAQLLRENYRELGPWPLAITAYNHGVHGMKRAVAQLGTTDFRTIVQRYRSRIFGFASKNFYAEFLTVVAILKHPTATFPNLTFDTPRKYHTLTLDAYVTLPMLEKYLRLNRRDIVRWNPALRRAVVQGRRRIPKGVTLYVPQDRLSRSALQTRWAKVPTRLKLARPPRPGTYRVRAGDTLWTVAKRTGTTVKTLARVNGLKRPYVIRVGRVLRLPEAASRCRPATAKTGNTCARQSERPQASLSDSRWPASPPTSICVSLATLYGAAGRHAMENCAAQQDNRRGPGPVEWPQTALPASSRPDVAASLTRHADRAPLRTRFDPFPCPET